jgi:hypothetical protein
VACTLLEEEEEEAKRGTSSSIYASLHFFIRYAQNQKIGKSNISKVFGSNKTKRPKTSYIH